MMGMSRVNNENHLDFRLLRRHDGFDPGPEINNPSGIFK
jgi:hypothetical protein